jgi:molybdopterin converting factor subunit 1
VPDRIRVTVRLFASLRERAGTGTVALEVPSATPVGAVWALLPGIGAVEPPAGVRWAVNRAFTLPGAPLADGDEVAIVPPVSGG